MAKGNMLLGYSRGSVGDVVFYRDGGSQRQRARNRKPNNPNTEPQVKQRSKFANAVKFFTQFNSSFFKFAFEDKKTNESDYNAFMRHNVTRSGYIGAAANKIANWPALGLWQMSDGSLPSITAPFPQPHNKGVSFKIDLEEGVGTFLTVAQLTSELLKSANWREGDIVTIPWYAVTPYSSLPTINTASTPSPAASNGFVQFVLDSSNQDDLPLFSINGEEWFIRGDLNGGVLRLFPVNSDADLTQILIGFAVVHSRNTPQGLQVSTSSLTWVQFDGNQKAIPSEVPLAALLEDTTYYASVLSDWGAAVPAVLQGLTARANYPYDAVSVTFDNIEQTASPNGVVSFAYSTNSPNIIVRMVKDGAAMPFVGLPSVSTNGVEVSAELSAGNAALALTLGNNFERSSEIYIRFIDGRTTTIRFN